MKLYKLILTITFIVGVFVIGTLLYFRQQYYEYIYKSGYNNPIYPIKFQINKGDTLNVISEKLYIYKIIDKQWVFKWYVQQKNLSQSLQAGTFVINKDNNIPQITDILTGKTVNQLKITIPEGYNIAQIDQLLSNKNLIKSGEFIKCTQTCDFSEFKFLDQNKTNKLEGYLFPDTYHIDLNQFQVKILIFNMLTLFEKKITPYTTDIKHRDYTLDEIINVASMIEKEAIIDQERAMISDVIWKRLESNMFLGIDATLRYEKNNWKTELTNDDIQNNSLYNTRKKLGLPPTPISNPGIKSIKAALYPKKNNYYYYLHDQKKEIHFSKTLNEHNQNVYKYLR